MAHARPRSTSVSGDISARSRYQQALSRIAAADAARASEHTSAHHPTHTDKGKTYRTQRPLSRTEAVLGAGESAGSPLDLSTWIDGGEDDPRRQRGRHVQHPVRIASTVTLCPLKESFMARLDGESQKAPRTYIWVPEAATLLEISVDTVDGLIGDGRLHAYRPGGKYGHRRIQVSALMAYIHAECNMAPTQIAMIEEAIQRMVRQEPDAAP